VRHGERRITFRDASVLVGCSSMGSGHLQFSWQRADVTVEGGIICAVVPAFKGRNRTEGLEPAEEIDAHGKALIPGLHDHHVHLRAMAAFRASVDLKGLGGRGGAELARRLAEAPVQGAAGWVRAVGYDEDELGLLDRWALDKAISTRPVRVKHRSGRLWVLNTKALVEVGLLDPSGARRGPALGGSYPPATGVPGTVGVETDPDGLPNGRLWGLDGWLGSKLPPLELDLGRVSREAASFGVSGFTDATPGRDQRELEAFREMLERSGVCQRVVAMGVGQPGVPFKVVLEDPSLPDLQDLCELIDQAHGAYQPVAIHCVSEASLALAVAALEQAGTLRGDRLEHASVSSDSAVEQIARLGLCVVTQPHFLLTRGDSWRKEAGARATSGLVLYRCGSLVAAGVPVAFGTDAPVGCANPWVAMACAMQRRTLSGVVMDEAEAVGVDQALAGFLGDPLSPGTPRVVRAGQRADLCLLRCGPQELRGAVMDCAASCTSPVEMTLVAGSRAFLRGSPPPWMLDATSQRG